MGNVRPGPNLLYCGTTKSSCDDKLVSDIKAACYDKYIRHLETAMVSNNPNTQLVTSNNDITMANTNEMAYMWIRPIIPENPNEWYDQCLEIAEIYGDAVRLFGDSAHTESQESHCICCPE